MSIGTGAAIAIAAGVGAGASIYGANKSSNAAKDASAQQQQSAQQAYAATTPLYDQALSIAGQQAAQGQARLDPYAQQGAAGLTALSAYLGVPMAAKGAAPAAAAPGAAAAPTAPKLYTLPGTPQDQIRQLYVTASGGRYAPTQADLDQWGPHPDAQYLQKIGPAIQQWWAQNQGQFPGGAATPGAGGAAAPAAAPTSAAPTSDVVHMKSPSGELGWLPRARVADAIAAGGTVVP